jgi:hypothetical protein
MSEFVKSRLRVVFIDWDGAGPKMHCLALLLTLCMPAFAACERIGICLNKVIEHGVRG